MDIKIELNSAYSRFSKNLSEIERNALKKANPKALKRTLTTLRVETKKELSSTYKVPQRLFSNRIKDSLSSTKQQGRFWAGLNEFELYNLGKAVQMSTGVKVNDYFERGAFIQTVRKGQTSQKTSVWRRLPYKNEKKQYAIEKVKVELEEANNIVEKAANKYGLSRYRKVLEQEVSHIISTMSKS